MKLSLLILISLHAAVLTTARTSRIPRRPQCVCTGKVSAIMQDATGTYCVYYGPEATRQWYCENQDEWTVYLSMMSSVAKEPRCQCTGDVTAIMQDETGTYCVFYSETENRHWECENKEEWDLYRNKEY